MTENLTEEQAHNAVRILARRYRKPPKKARSRIDTLHPALHFLFDEMDHLGITDAEMTTKSGLSPNVLGNWRNGKGPYLYNMEFVLNTIGYTLAAIPLPEGKK